MKIHRREDVAFLFLGELVRAYSSRLVTLNEVSRKHGISLLYLKKIARFLRRANLIDSKEGLHGGYMLTLRPSNITLWDVVQALSIQSAKYPENQLQTRYCPIYSQCLPQKIRLKLEEALASGFRQLSLSQLIGG